MPVLRATVPKGDRNILPPRTKGKGNHSVSDAQTAPHSRLVGRTLLQGVLAAGEGSAEFHPLPSGTIAVQTARGREGFFFFFSKKPNLSNKQKSPTSPSVFPPVRV